MAKVLTDLYSLYSFERIYDQKVKDDFFVVYEPHFLLIENLILSEKVILDRNCVRHYQLESICDQLSGAFGFITDRRLYSESGVYNILTTDNDMSARGVLYADVARDNDIYFSPHPNREAILLNKISKYINSTATKVINHVDQKIRETESGLIANIDIRTPPLVKHVLYYSKLHNITITDSINEIRNSKNARMFRRCQPWRAKRRLVVPDRRRRGCMAGIATDRERCRAYRERIRNAVESLWAS